MQSTLKLALIVFFVCSIAITLAEVKKKKNIQDLSDAEIEKIYDEWEVN
jgi:hypothetical protein